MESDSADLASPRRAQLIALHEAKGIATAKVDSANADAEFCRTKLALPAEQLNPPPLLTGNDLVDHGVPKGAVFRRLLDRVRQAQLDTEIHTRDEALAFVDRLLEEGN